jgi:nitrite reductase/ring-hydroxylating ferredoxin subunit
MAEFFKAALVSNLPNNSMKSVSIDGKDVLIVNANGVFFAMDAICKHSDWNLEDGTLKDTIVTCAGHGAAWDLKTGKAEYAEELPSNELYEVKVDGDQIYVRRSQKAL